MTSPNSQSRQGTHQLWLSGLEQENKSIRVCLNCSSSSLSVNRYIALLALSGGHNFSITRTGQIELFLIVNWGLLYTPMVLKAFFPLLNGVCPKHTRHLSHDTNLRHAQQLARLEFAVRSSTCQKKDADVGCRVNSTNLTSVIIGIPSLYISCNPVNLIAS